MSLGQGALAGAGASGSGCGARARGRILPERWGGAGYGLRRPRTAMALAGTGRQGGGEVAGPASAQPGRAGAATRRRHAEAGAATGRAAGARARLVPAAR